MKSLAYLKQLFLQKVRVLTTAEGLREALGALAEETVFEPFTAAELPATAQAYAGLSKRAVLLKLLGGAPVITPPTPGPASVWYKLKGQSNAQGQARKADLPADLQGPQAGEYIYTPFTGAFAVVEGGVNTDSAGGDNWGLEMRLLKRMRAALGVDVYLSKFAVPGTQLAPGGSVIDWSPTSPGEYFDQAQANDTAARAALPVPSSPPAAIIWFQGEGDANASGAAGYAAELADFAAAERAPYPGVVIPFVIISLNVNQTFLDPTFLAQVMAAQAAVSRTVADTYLVLTDGLPLDTPKLHLTGPGLDTLGGQVADLLLAIAAGTATNPPAMPTVVGDDIADTLYATHQLGVSQLEQRENGGSWVPYAGQIAVGNVTRDPGYYEFRVKPAGNRPASAPAPSPAFTVASTAPGAGTPAVGVNLLASADLGDTTVWQYSDLSSVVPVANYAGTAGAAYRLNLAASGSDNKGYHNKQPVALAGGGRYLVPVQAKMGQGARILTIWVVNASFATLGIVHFDLTDQSYTGLLPNSVAGVSATAVDLGNGWFEYQLTFPASNNESALLFAATWPDVAGINQNWTPASSDYLLHSQPRLYKL